MANATILDKYAIKEVADVMFYELDSAGAPSAPVLYIDTAKVTTISQSSEQVDARGGKSNVKLLSWDTNKELTLELTDALFSAKSLGIMFGGTMEDNGNTQEVLKSLRENEIDLVENNQNMATFKINGQELYIATSKLTFFAYGLGDTTAAKALPTPVKTPTWSPKNFHFVTFDLLDCVNKPSNGSGVVTNGITINVGAEFNANTYYITGDTYARNYQSGQDEFLQFIIPKGKVSAEDVSLTMEADGDPAEFTMNIECLKAVDGTMLKLVKYSLGSTSSAGTGHNKGVASVLDDYNEESEHAEYATVAKDGYDASVITAGSLNETSVIPD